MKVTIKIGNEIVIEYSFDKPKELQIFQANDKIYSSLIEKILGEIKGKEGREITKIPLKRNKLKELRSEDISLKREASARMPDQMTLIRYIMSRDKYEHDIFEIQRKFLNREFLPNRENHIQNRIYENMFARMKRAQKVIEKQEGKKFESEWRISSDGRKAKVFWIGEKNKIYS